MWHHTSQPCQRCARIGSQVTIRTLCGHEDRDGVVHPLPQCRLPAVLPGKRRGVQPFADVLAAPTVRLALAAEGVQPIFEAHSQQAALPVGIDPRESQPLKCTCPGRAARPCRPPRRQPSSQIPSKPSPRRQSWFSWSFPPWIAATSRRFPRFLSWPEINVWSPLECGSGERSFSHYIRELRGDPPATMTQGLGPSTARSRGSKAG